MPAFGFVFVPVSQKGITHEISGNLYVYIVFVAVSLTNILNVPLCFDAADVKTQLHVAYFLSESRDQHRPQQVDLH